MLESRLKKFETDTSTCNATVANIIDDVRMMSSMIMNIIPEDEDKKGLTDYINSIEQSLKHIQNLTTDVHKRTASFEKIEKVKQARSESSINGITQLQSQGSVLRVGRSSTGDTQRNAEIIEKKFGVPVSVNINILMSKYLNDY